LLGVKRLKGPLVISSASLIEYPQQVRAPRVIATRGGGIATQAVILDQVLRENLGSVWLGEPSLGSSNEPSDNPG